MKRALFILSCCISAGSALAQESGVRVRVLAGNGIPLSGSLVALIDQAGTVHAEGVSSEAGTRMLSAPAGTYRIRVRRIGYQPFLSESVTLPRRSEYIVRVDDRKVVLSAMLIRADNKCAKFEIGSESLAMVWEEISKALLSSKLTSSDLEGLGRARIYRKQIDGGGEVVSSDTTYVPIRDRAPFSAVDPAILAREGYVMGNPRDGWTYFGVDESILLSPAFTTTHCFKLVRDKKRPGQLGMVFEPVPGQKMSDVKGALFIDDKSLELRDIVFQFTNAGLMTRFGAGGATKFRRLPSGAFIVEDWSLRAPKLVIAYAMREQVTVLGYVEDGGGVVVAATSRPGNFRKGVLRGVVFDSLAMRPIEGATVTASGATASSDSMGRFAFTGIPVEEQTVTFTHPSFSQLGFMALERTFELKADTTDIVLATPSLRTFWGRTCGDTTVKIRSSWTSAGVMHGTVRDTLGNPVAGALLKMFWTEQPSDRRTKNDQANLKQEATTDANGFYAVCGFVPTSRGTVFASVDNVQTERRDFSFDRQRIVRRDLQFSSIRRIVETGVNEILVTVFSAAGGMLSDAIVFIEGSERISRTNDSGEATLRAAKKVAVVGIKRLGFSEQSLKISLGPNSRHRLQVTLHPVQTLPTVPVRADALLPTELERRRSSGGTASFFGREELDRVNTVKNLMTRVPLARIDSNRGAQWRFYFPHPQGIGSCLADLYVDGVLAPNQDEINSIAPEDMAAVEVYPHVGQAPQNVIRMQSGCGVILMWTKFWAKSRQPMGRERPRSDSIPGESSQTGQNWPRTAPPVL